ncbi:hypothetical protein [Armatimonas sp.]
MRECNDAAALLAWLPLEIEGWVRAPMASKFGQLAELLASLGDESE